MVNPRWRKVWHDLWGNKLRSLLVILTIAVGVFAIGFVSNMLFVTVPTMDADYLKADPHSAIIYPDPFDDDMVASLQRVPGVGQVEGRSSIGAQVTLPNGDVKDISITAIPAVEKIRIDRLRPAGDEPLPRLGRGEIYLERSGASVLGLAPGDILQVELSDGRVRELKLAAYAQVSTDAPYFFGQSFSGYVDKETLVDLGGGDLYDTLLLSVAEDQFDEAHVREVAEAAADKIEASGREVYFTLVYQPGRHFASDITKALAGLMMFLGIMAVFLGAFLVINTISALLSQQVRQIGVMKAIGARTGQLLAMYLVTVLGFSLIALALAVPLSFFLSQTVGSGINVMLNFQPGPPKVPIEGIALQVFVAVVIPLAATVVPVVQGARIPVRQALASYGLGQSGKRRGIVDRLVERIRGLPRPLLISLRNTFRRKGRLALTLSTLILAGAIFIGVYSLRTSIGLLIDQVFGYVLTDVNVGFSQAYRTQKVLPLALSIPGVVDGESWGQALGSVLTEDGSTGTQVSIIAPPANSTLIEPTMTEGRWLVPEDENAIVIGNHLLAERPELKVGDQVTIDIDGEQREWTIVGLYRMGGTAIPPIIYSNQEYFSKVTGQVNRTFSLRLTTAQHDLPTQLRVADDLEKVYDVAGVGVGNIVTGGEQVQANVQTTNVLVYFLLIMSLLISVVGALGLASTMSMNVLERTREIGVIRAIGATNRAIMQLVIVEGLLIGLISWAVGAVLAVPIGTGLALVVGTSMFNGPMDFVFSWEGLIIWLVLSLIISVLASALPARSAARLTVREVLAYE